MNRFAPLALALALGLAACGDDADQAEGTDPDAPLTTEETSTRSETREAVDAMRDAGGEIGEAARSATEDAREALGPAMERAREIGGNALEAAQEGLNDATRSAACQTARAAEDVDGIAANC